MNKGRSKSYISLLFMAFLTATGVVLLYNYIRTEGEKKPFTAVYAEEDYDKLNHFELLEKYSQWSANRPKSLFDFLKRPQKPNIILISIDTLRADRLSCYGDKKNTSPYMDHLGRYGVLFRNTVSQSPKTMPSHMTMFTGLYPSVHQSRLGFENGNYKIFPLNENVGTLPQWLKRAGYQTAAWTGGGQMAGAAGFDRGFDVYKERFLIFLVGRRMKEIKKWFADHSQKPCFLFIHTYQMHTPYSVPKQYIDLFYKGGYAGEIVGNYDELIKLSRETGDDLQKMFWGDAFYLKDGEFTLKRDKLTDEDIRYVKALYEANVRYTDDVLRAFFTELIRSGLMDNTIVIITSDHGEEFLEHGGFFHTKLYTETMHVPLIIFYPKRLPMGKVVDLPVRLIDLAPTILDLAGIPVPAQVRGRSMMEFIFGKGKPRPAYSEEPWFLDTYHRSYRWGRYVVYDKGEKGRELYDIRKDPYEMTDISAEHPEILESMESGLKKFENSPYLKPFESSRTGEAIPEDRMRQLKDLGYVE